MGCPVTEHSPAAIAAYPYVPRPDSSAYDLDVDVVVEAARTAYDRGVADTLAMKLEADRQSLRKAIHEARLAKRPTGYPTLTTIETVDAIFAAGIIHEAGKPVVDVEALAKALAEADASWGQPAMASERDAFYLNRAAVLTAADGPLQDAREVKAQALEDAAAQCHLLDEGTSATEWVIDRAAEIRAALA